MGTTGYSPVNFTGASEYSTQLQTVIAKAVSAASGPLTQLQSQQTTLQNQQTELSTLSSNFAALQSSIESVNSATGLGAYSASVDNTSIASATVSSGVMGGTYALTVASMGSRTNTMSQNGLNTVTDPTSGNIDSSTTYTLSLNGTNYSITDTAGTLNGLAQAINTSGANVQATVVNVGGSSSPDYRLSIQSLDYAPDTVQLSDGTNNLLNTLTTGSYVQYQVNGEPATPINSSSRSIDLSTGLTVNVLGTGSTNITVAQSDSSMTNALSSFVNAYNNVVNELDKNRGQNGGALSGDSIVYQLQGALQNITNYTAASGNITALSQIGISFDENGQMQFDPSAMSQASTSDVLNFFGSESGGGFLQAASNIMTSITDPSTGTLPNATQSLSTQLTSIQSKISDDQQQISALQTTLTQQMNAADAAISSMEQQVYEITTLFTDMQQQNNPNG
jgi:flagellar hook-associated protein 2